ncbi:SGNH/GDSL hydrolase family protein [Changchengzhania lutea]|uniref:SGNH/GDSL hydrolase family protein n=1 Tax=Changchengzhania lutea TaxID=2049305 RepID=UPI00115F65A9|nr:SGNH/GDSL hydrolase family protein [Changchengzhania lutea]
MKKLRSLFLVVLCMSLFTCSTNDDATDLVEIEEQEETLPDETDETEGEVSVIRLLALGDSYTIGQSVCETCRFPEQLKDSLFSRFESQKNFELKIIAKTGWTTTNLINAIESESLDANYDLVTLLIGVNNQFQNRPFSIYEKEFPELVNTAISKAKDDKSKLIVVSIPDYAFTPYGNGNPNITSGINTYNAFAKSYCDANSITFINITDITRMGLDNPNLVASDGLHPSEFAYSKFAERLSPIAYDRLR